MSQTWASLDSQTIVNGLVAIVDVFADNNLNIEYWMVGRLMIVVVHERKHDEINYGRQVCTHIDPEFRRAIASPLEL